MTNINIKTIIDTNNTYAIDTTIAYDNNFIPEFNQNPEQDYNNR